MLKINLAETKAIEEERTQILRKEFKSTIKMIAEYFKFPKLF
jgi:lauroyl/myristoyl acyltransferase